MSKLKHLNRIVRGQKWLHQRKGSFLIGFEDSVRVSRSEMMREGIPKRRASISKTTRGKSNVDMRLGDEIEGGRAKLTQWSVRV